MKTKKAKASREKLESAKSKLYLSRHNNIEMGKESEVLEMIKVFESEIELSKEIAEEKRLKLTKPFEKYVQNKSGAFASEKASDYDTALKTVQRNRDRVINLKLRLDNLRKLEEIDLTPLELRVESEQARHAKVIESEVARIEKQDAKKALKQKADRERASVPVNIFSAESANGRRFLMEDLLAGMSKRVGKIRFGNQDYDGGIPVKEFLYILRLHKKGIAEINFAPKDEENRVNVFINYDGGYSKFSFIAHELGEDDIVSLVTFGN